jgi:alpha-D-ribose 1-methylphosphonate 5-triphosphate synthase subunit PhnG
MQNEPQSTHSDRGDLASRRRDAMAVLAEGATAEIARLMAGIGPLPTHQEIRKAESGLVMVRGRIGGDGAPFNLGEATVTRAAVRLVSGETGFAYVLGREQRKARLIAICDAMLQAKAAEQVLNSVVVPLEQAMLARRHKTDAETAATRVNFFTLVRGEG